MKEKSKYQRMIAAMTPEQLQQYKAYQAAYRKKYREKEKAKIAAMTPEELAEYKAKWSERWRAYRIAKMAAMAPEKLAEYKAKESARSNAYQKAKLGAMSPEDKQKWHEFRNEYNRNWRHKDPARLEQIRAYDRKRKREKRIIDAAKAEIEYHYQIGELTRKERNRELEHVCGN